MCLYATSRACTLNQRLIVETKIEFDDEELAAAAAAVAGRRAEGAFDLTKVPDILDNIRYDLEHNQKRLPLRGMPELYTLAKEFADSYVPQEYGMTSRDKVVIGTKMCSELLKKIRNDLILGTEGNRDGLSGDGGNDMQYTLDGQ